MGPTLICTTEPREFPGGSPALLPPALLSHGRGPPPHQPIHKASQTGPRCSHLPKVMMFSPEQSMAPYWFGQVQALSLAASPQHLYPLSLLTLLLSFFTHALYCHYGRPWPFRLRVAFPSLHAPTSACPVNPYTSLSLFWKCVCPPLLEARRLSSEGASYLNAP